MKRNDFPNDWPAYLTESMLFTPITSIAPVGSSGLLFKEMHEYQFEQFCWFLLQKDHYLKGCQQLGVRGTRQEGIDIFASDKFNASQLIVFECKCWKKFKRTELIEAIDKFTASPWIKYKPQFILILAQDGLGSLSKTWLEQSARLNKIGIKSDVWTGRNLTERIQHFPDIVTRFFGAQNAQYICHDWMRKVRFIERLHYAYTDKSEEIREIAEEYLRNEQTQDSINFEQISHGVKRHTDFDNAFNEFKAHLVGLVHHENAETRRLAKEFLNRISNNDSSKQSVSRNVEVEITGKDLDNEKSVEIFDNNDNWTIKHPAVYIHCLKPGKRMYPASVLIKFSQENASGVDVTLRQKWMFEYLLGAEGTPANSKYRPFIVGDFISKSVPHTVIQLPNCRLYPKTEIMGDICSVIDRLSHVITSALLKLEKLWDAVDFPFVNQGGTTYVALCTMPKWLWNVMLEFGIEHDVSNGETEWHIFDRNDYALKVLTNKIHPDFDFGYHSIFYARDDLEGANFGNSTVILWKPPDSFDRYEVASRKWMPCNVAFEWLANKLLPRVKVWRLEQKLKEVGIFKRASSKKSFEYVWNRDAEIRDLRQIPLLRGKRYWKVGLLETILQLQYSTGIMRREIYLTKLEVKNIFEALLLVLSFKLGRVTDIASNLSIGHAVESHDDIIIFLRGKLEKDELAINMLSLRYLLSAFLAALNDNDDFLSQDQKKIIFQAMIPIMADQDKRQLFQRHSRWID